MSTQVVMYSTQKAAATSTLVGKQLSASTALLASATANSLTAAQALAAAQANASLVQNVSTTYSTILFNSQLKAVLDPNLLLSNQLVFNSRSNARVATWSNTLLAQANQETALYNLENANLLPDYFIYSCKSKKDNDDVVNYKLALLRIQLNKINTRV
jgi:hypothetical protein